MAYNPRDSYYKKAKQEGYRSRAAYKLLELQQRYRLLKPLFVKAILFCFRAIWRGTRFKSKLKRS